mgnify:CR=1|tara:strand:- start:438 stop:1055 length:618 start_codon:yes stop_codon:yes gene_type:complete
MKKSVFVIFFLSTFFISKAGNPKIDYEMFSIGGNFVYSIEDRYSGLNGKITMPLSSKFVSFIFQGTFFPSQMQLSEKTKNELRSKINIQITPIHIGKFSTYLQAGFDNGMWKRNYNIISSDLDIKWKIDESMMFGAGFNYNLKGVRFYADWMYMPDIYRNHLGIGIHILFFEKKLYRKFYMRPRKRHNIFNIKFKRKKKRKNFKL